MFSRGSTIVSSFGRVPIPLPDPRCAQHGLTHPVRVRFGITELPRRNQAGTLSRHSGSDGPRSLKKTRRTPSPKQQPTVIPTAFEREAPGKGRSRGKTVAASLCLSSRSCGTAAAEWRNPSAGFRPCAAHWLPTGHGFSGTGFSLCAFHLFNDPGFRPCALMQPAPSESFQNGTNSSRTHGGMNTRPRGRLTPLEYALTSITTVTHVESTLAKWQVCKPCRMNTYTKQGEGVGALCYVPNDPRNRASASLH
jgi:hypothetical protein